MRKRYVYTASAQQPGVVLDTQRSYALSASLAGISSLVFWPLSKQTNGIVGTPFGGGARLRSPCNLDGTTPLVCFHVAYAT